MLYAEALTVTGSGSNAGALEVSQVSPKAMATKFDIAAVVIMKKKTKANFQLCFPGYFSKDRVSG